MTWINELKTELDSMALLLLDLIMLAGFPANILYFTRVFMLAGFSANILSLSRFLFFFPLFFFLSFDLVLSNHMTYTTNFGHNMPLVHHYSGYQAQMVTHHTSLEVIELYT